MLFISAFSTVLRKYYSENSSIYEHFESAAHGMTLQST